MEKIQSKKKGLLIIYGFYLISYLLSGLCLYLLRNIVTSIALQLLTFTLVATLFVFLCSLVVKNTSVYDLYWSLTPQVMITYLLIINISTVNAYHIVLFVAFSFWSIRLSVNWTQTFTHLGEEDWRYADFRKSLNPFMFQIVNFFGLQFMPTFLVYMGFLPLVSFFRSEANAWSLVGSAIIIIGTLFELFADISMHKHLKEGVKGSVNKRGLWKYSRHPNYFGEILIWVGSFVALILTDSSLWKLGIGVILMVLLFQFISIPLAETRQKKRRPEYHVYIQETSRLLPLPKRNIK